MPANEKRVVGMIHLRPLPGSPRYGGSMQQVIDAAMLDARELAAGGVAAMMLENFGDTPFHAGIVPAETIAAITAAAVAVRRETPDLPLGINCLRNDGRGALAIAVASGASFIRVNVLCGARVTDQGIIEGDAANVLRDRARLGNNIEIWADIDVKHSAPLAARKLEDEVHDTLQRGHADALIVSGAGTGKPIDVQQAKRVREAAGNAPIYAGSGVTAESIVTLAPHLSGFIVGTWVKKDSRVENAVDRDRVRRLVDAAWAAGA